MSSPPFADDDDPHNFQDALCPAGPVGGRVYDFPLHSRIVQERSTSIISYIVDAYHKNPNSIRAEDDVGITPLYAAAASCDYHALKALLDLGVSDQIQSRHSFEKLTALEACERSPFGQSNFLAHFRLQQPSVEEGGTQKVQLRCVAKLKRAARMPEMNGITDD
jgi:hypothetical protein